MFVDGQQVAQAHIEKTVRSRFSLDETFDVGADTASAVVEDYADKMPFEFTGKLIKLVIKLGKSGATASDKKVLEEVYRKVAAVRE